MGRAARRSRPRRAPATRPGTFVDLNLALTQLGKPTIAMVNGHALAGGLGLVVACDIAIAADDAQFGTPEINVGLWPMMIMATIFRNVPRKRGLELIMTGDKISAAEAAEIGLITRAVPEGQARGRGRRAGGEAGVEVAGDHAHSGSRRSTDSGHGAGAGAAPPRRASWSRCSAPRTRARD